MPTKGQFASINGRLDARTVKTDGCWFWMGALTNEGYGVLGHNYRQFKVHRLSYERHREPIPPDLTIDHLCSNRRCVNPSHLEVVTVGENTRRSNIKRKQTHCANGHELSPDNLLFDKEGSRRCRRCRARWYREFRARRSGCGIPREETLR